MEHGANPITQHQAIAAESFWQHISETVATWQRRVHTRRELRCALTRLDDRLWRDMGFTPYEAREEAYRPFWKD